MVKVIDSIKKLLKIESGTPVDLPEGPFLYLNAIRNDGLKCMIPFSDLHLFERRSDGRYYLKTSANLKND